MTTTHRALIVPVDVEQPCVVYDLADEDVPDIARIVADDPEQGIYDFVNVSKYGFIIAVDDIGYLRRRPLNTRAINYLRTATGVQQDYPIYGTALFMGTTPQGDYAHVPARVLRAAGIDSKEDE